MFDQHDRWNVVGILAGVLMFVLGVTGLTQDVINALHF